MISPIRLFKLLSFWPPYLGAGIKVDYVADDFSRVDVSMKLKFWNKNYVNTHFGGSLYSMTDPFYMLMLLQRLGKNYIVWDKAAKIDFIRPGKGKVHCSFVLTDSMIDGFKTQLQSQDRLYPEFLVEVFDEKNELICTVLKTLYIKRKKQ